VVPAVQKVEGVLAQEAGVGGGVGLPLEKKKKRKKK